MSAEDDICLGRLFFNAPTRIRPRHPHVIASDPAQDPANVVVVNLSTEPCLGDVSYRVEAKEHPAVSEQSYIRCDFAEVTTTAVLKASLAKQEISLSQVVSAATLRKIQRALGESRRPSRDLQGILRQQGFIK